MRFKDQDRVNPIITSFNNITPLLRISEQGLRCVKLFQAQVSSIKCLSNKIWKLRFQPSTYVYLDRVRFHLCALPISARIFLAQLPTTTTCLLLNLIPLSLSLSLSLSLPPKDIFNNNEVFHTIKLRDYGYYDNAQLGCIQVLKLLSIKGDVVYLARLICSRLGRPRIRTSAQFPDSHHYVFAQILIFWKNKKYQFTGPVISDAK